MKTGISIKPTKEDLKRFAGSGSQRSQLAKATAWRCLCIMQEEEGPGYPALDFLAHEMTTAYRKNWAKKLLAA